jgi:hypothetical protein
MAAYDANFALENISSLLNKRCLVLGVCGIFGALASFYSELQKISAKRGSLEGKCFITREFGSENFSNLLEAVLEISLSFFLITTVLAINAISDRITAIGTDFKTFQNSVLKDEEILFFPTQTQNLGNGNKAFGKHLTGNELSSLISRLGHLMECRNLMEQSFGSMTFIFTTSGILMSILFIYLALIRFKDAIEVPVLQLIASLLPLTALGILALIRLLVLAETGQKLENSVSVQLGQRNC